MTLALRNASVFAHQANINRYRKLLTSDLTVNEREFIERRLGEEEEALRQMAGSAALNNRPSVVKRGL